MKLKAYGVDGSILKWFSSFLTTRWQCVVVNGCASDWSPVLSSVPQGSILGPWLFILYINDFPSLVSSPMKTFADDVAIYCPVTSTADYRAFQNDLDLILSWCPTWQMRLNLSKCEFYAFLINIHPSNILTTSTTIFLKSVSSVK